MSVPWAGGSDVPGNASGGALSEAGRRYDMARGSCFRMGIDFVAGIWREMDFHGHEVDNGAGFFYCVEEYRWGSPLRRSLVRGGLLWEQGFRLSGLAAGALGLLGF